MVSHFEGRRVFAVYASLPIAVHRFSFVHCCLFVLTRGKKREIPVPKFMYIRSMKIPGRWKTSSSINCVMNTIYRYRYWLVGYRSLFIRNWTAIFPFTRYAITIRIIARLYLFFEFFHLLSPLFFWNGYLNIIANLLIFVHLKISHRQWYINSYK